MGYNNKYYFNDKHVTSASYPLDHGPPSIAKPHYSQPSFLSAAPDGESLAAMLYPAHMGKQYSEPSAFAQADPLVKPPQKKTHANPLVAKVTQWTGNRSTQALHPSAAANLKPQQSLSLTTTNVIYHTQGPNSPPGISPASKTATLYPRPGSTLAASTNVDAKLKTNPRPRSPHADSLLSILNGHHRDTPERSPNITPEKQRARLLLERERAKAQAARQVKIDALRKKYSNAPRVGSLLSGKIVERNSALANWRFDESTKSQEDVRKSKMGALVRKPAVRIYKCHYCKQERLDFNEVRQINRRLIHLRLVVIAEAAWRSPASMAMLGSRQDYRAFEGFFLDFCATITTRLIRRLGCTECEDMEEVVDESDGTRPSWLWATQEDLWVDRFWARLRREYALISEQSDDKKGN
ncbi:hypothetical protein EIP91_004364 [Steccherinum ochraceum]|uniref:Uncharacterized protein n=1 Tax=Steccherinum ochraceum TaxID=92696 RepID=A0A4R0RUD6_9APHY|nr:hypothetical protein EIP91_004364 [Steccherinum ochraceum]